MAEQLAMFSPPELSGLAGAFDQAADEWGLNCGPGAICGALALHPETVRPHLGKFEQRRRRYMSPLDMWSALRSLSVPFRAVNVEGWSEIHVWPKSNGICRVQWGGPWCDEGRPAVAAYRHTHWVAGRRSADDGSIWVFDVNNLIGPGGMLVDEHGLPLGPDGWLPYVAWAGAVVPHLLPARGDGRWWLTHTAEIRRAT